MSNTKVSRPSDKHQDHDLQIIRAGADGDFTVSISGTDPVTGHFVSLSVVFCNPGNGGGQSPETYRALPALIEAMGKDKPPKSR